MTRISLFVAGALAAAVLAGGATAESTAPAAKKCPRGKAPVTIMGKKSCRAVAQVVPRRRVGNGLAPALRTGLDPTWGETRDGPKTLTELVGPETTRAIEQRITSALESFGRQSRGRHLAAVRAGLGCTSSQVLPESSSGYKQAMEGGGEFSVQMTTGSAGANMEMSVTIPPKSGRAVRITVNLSLCSGERLEVKECPTNRGVVEGTDNISGEIKVEQLEDGDVVESTSTKIAITTKLRGEVETDAKLRLLEIDRTESYATSVDFGRWLGASFRTTLHRRATLSMPSGSVVSGTSSLDVRQSFHGLLSFLVDKTAARNATINAAKRASDEAWSKFTDEAVKKYREREAGWQKPVCAELQFSPKSHTLRVLRGQQGRFTGSVKAKRGGSTPGKWKITARKRLGVRPGGGEGATKSFTYRVDGDGEVSVTFRVTSKAGVAEGIWAQGASKLPRRVIGSFSGTTGPNDAYSWSGTVTFLRDPDRSSPQFAMYAVANVVFTVTFVVNEFGCTGRSETRAALGSQPTANLLISPEPTGRRGHRYMISLGLTAPPGQISVTCAGMTLPPMPWTAVAVFTTIPKTFYSDLKTFSGTNTLPGTVSFTWSLRGSQ